MDEDWKARVQREKEDARLKTQQQSPDIAAPPTSSSTEIPAPEEGGEVDPFFEALLNMLATQAMYCLGLLGAPGQGQAVVNLDQAREFIEMITMLRDKTRGNVNAPESAALSETLAELHRLYSARVQQAQAQAMQRAGVDLNNLRGETP